MINGIELFSRTEVVSLEEFGAEFSSFRVLAQRLEAYPEYNVPTEVAARNAFETGTSVDQGFNQDWHDILGAARTRGAKVERVRVLPPARISYIEFEIEHGYVPSSRFGEIIRFVEYDTFLAAVGEAGASPDFWLFDDARAYVMAYDARGTFMGVMKAQSAALPGLRELYSALIAKAHDLEWALGRYVRSPVH